ncbi:MAG: xanthine dehydrogenase family protein molybdopterin-binding subunit [Clostridiales bacterium]|nr:xanthine dehydrogenase family protein molybdopterin-binding subunit [Clostridiales bacterium]
MGSTVGSSVRRKEAWAKVTGGAIYSGDLPTAGALCARLLTSTHAHARILRIDTARAQSAPGVKVILTGDDCPELFGPLIRDRPPLARDVVRYAGEPVALVVALSEWEAEAACRLIAVEYAPLPAVLSPFEALATGAPLVHDRAYDYARSMADLYPETGTNIASRYHIQKGDPDRALAECDAVIRRRYSLPPSDHLAMEVRAARAEIAADGVVTIDTSSQAPYTVRQQLAESLHIPAGQIRVRVPFVGGGFGGKAPVTVEILAYLASRRVGGRAVRLTISREQDMAFAPCRIGLDAQIAIGATGDGRIRGAQMTYLVDCGAYADISPYMAKAVAADGTGPYAIGNLRLDALCVYTNHTFATSYRSFAHESYTFCVERTLDELARALSIDPLSLRRINAIGPGDLTPPQVRCTQSYLGDLPQCIERAKALSGWDGGAARPIKPGTVRAMGAACFWKTANPPTNAVSGALVTFNSDGSVNLNTGVVEMGSGSQTHLAQMLADKLDIGIDQVHVVMDVDTRTAPEHWKTVASLTGYMAGHAVVRAADDILNQLRAIGAEALACPQEDVVIARGLVFSGKSPGRFIPFKDIVQGYKAPGGASIGEPAIGRGGFMLKGLTPLDPGTGRGMPGPSQTVGAQVVEVEADLATHTYRIISASTAIDVGNAVDPEATRAMVAGGMAMGVSMASREAFHYDGRGVLTTPNLRSYKLLHIGQEPDYRVDLVETPDDCAPYGVRAFSEHGIIGIPAALGNALSAAFGLDVASLPLTPESLWRLSERKA